MKSNCRLLLASIALLLFTSMGTAYGITAGEKVKTKGLITARNGETLSMNTDAGNVVVVLSDKTKVGTPKGLLKRRTKNMAVTALVPGLRIEVQVFVVKQLADWRKRRACDGPRRRACDGPRRRACDGPRRRPEQGRRRVGASVLRRVQRRCRTLTASASTS